MRRRAGQQRQRESHHGGGTKGYRTSVPVCQCASVASVPVCHVPCTGRIREHREAKRPGQPRHPRHASRQAARGEGRHRDLCIPPARRQTADRGPGSDGQPAKLGGGAGSPGDWRGAQAQMASCLYSGGTAGSPCSGQGRRVQLQIPTCTYIQHLARWPGTCEILGTLVPCRPASPSAC